MNCSRSKAWSKQGLTQPWRRAALRRSARNPRLSPIRDPRSAPRCIAQVPYRAWYWLRGLLPVPLHLQKPFANLGYAKAHFQRANAPPKKFSRSPCSPSSRRKSNSASSPPSPNFSANSTAPFRSCERLLRVSVIAELQIERQFISGRDAIRKLLHLRFRHRSEALSPRDILLQHTERQHSHHSRVDRQAQRITQQVASVALWAPVPARPSCPITFIARIPRFFLRAAGNATS